LTGLVYCADCGGRMHYRRGVKTENGMQDHYVCKHSSKYPRKCTMHFIRTSVLRELILKVIRSTTDYVREHEDEFISLIRKASELKSDEAAKVQKKQLSKYQNRCAELDTLIKRLYEDKVKGELSSKRFEILVLEYEQEQEGLEKQIAELQETLGRFKDDSDKTHKFIDVVRKYTEIPELTGTILNEYIDKVVVHEGNKSNGRREQQVDIYLNFIGKVAIPEPESITHEEHVADKCKTKQRDYYYRNREKILAKMAEKRKAEKAAKARGALQDVLQTGSVTGSEIEKTA